MTTHFEIATTPDWESDKALAFDLDPKGLIGISMNRGIRIFLPKSQTVTQGGTTYVSKWILEKKSEELIEKYSGCRPWTSFKEFLGDKEIDLSEEAQGSDVDAAGVIEFFDHAVENLKYPKVTFPEGVQFSRAGSRSKAPGTVNITDGERYGQNKWYGRITRDGTFFPSRSCTAEVLDVVIRFCNDPVSEAVRAGKASGHCVFCTKELTVDKSLGSGFGPVCAKNYGLAGGK